jgi:hypothetical protein
MLRVSDERVRQHCTLTEGRARAPPRVQLALAKVGTPPPAPGSPVTRRTPTLPKTGISDIDELVAAFASGEDTNLALFNHVTEVGARLARGCRARYHAAHTLQRGCSRPGRACPRRQSVRTAHAPPLWINTTAGDSCTGLAI